MQIKHLDTLNIDTSRLGFGAMRMPTIDGEVDMATVTRMIDNAVAKGLTYFDTAYVYHNQKSEEVLREVLVKRYPRDSFTLADKIPVWLAKEEADVEPLFNVMLERLGVDYLDFCLLHALNAGRWEDCKKIKANETQLRLKSEGKIRFVGFSFHDSPAALKKILDEGTWDFVQLQINYFDWPDYAEECYKLASEKNIPIIVMEPIRGGSLAALAEDTTPAFRQTNPAWTDAAWALRFVANQPNVAVILSGMSNEEQVEQNLETFSTLTELTDAEKAAYDTVLAAIKSKALVPCTGCRYCMDCPFGVDIPAVFKLYNDYRMFNTQGPKNRYKQLASEGHGGDACQQCGACMEHCPQSIQTPDLLPSIHEEMMK